KGKSLVLKHKIKPKNENGLWNPKEYYFSIDTMLKDTGQFVKFGLVQPALIQGYNPECDCNYEQWETMLNWQEWEYGETKEIVFDSGNAFFGNSLFFNSAARDFSEEINSGFTPYKITLNNNIVSLWFSSDTAPTEKEITLNDLITYSKSICNSNDANVTWFDGNTYFINADGNVDIENCQLTINAGAVIKYKASTAATTSLVIKNKGVLKAQGASDNKIIFTSQNDDSLGSTATDSNGVPGRGDYNSAIYLFSNAGITSDANEFSHLDIGYGKQGIAINRYLGKVHDNNIHDNNYVVYGAGIYANAAVNNVYNNTFRGNVTAGEGAGMYASASGITANFYNNTFVDNNSNDDGVSYQNAGAFSSAAAIANFYNNSFSNNNGRGLAYGSGAKINGAVTNFYGNKFIGNNGYNGPGAYMFATITNFFDNNFTGNRAASFGGAIYYLGGLKITNFYNNKIVDNNAKSNGGAIYLYNTEITNFYNNLFKKNAAKTLGGGIMLYVDNWSSPKITNLYNNTFIDNRADTNGGAIYLNTKSADGKHCAEITNMYNNIFAYSKGSAVTDANLESTGGIVNANNNAFWANDKNANSYTEGTNTIYLGTTPFIDDGSDRNFLLNPYGIQQLEGMGNNTLGTDTYFQGRTVRYDNRLDYNRSTGFHYDQNSPYILITGPGAGTYSGNIPLDFNVSSSGTNADVSIDLNVINNSARDQNAFYLNQGYGSYACSQSLPSTTMDSNCTYTWNSTGTASGDYFVQGLATDNNGTGIIWQANAFTIGGAADYSFALMLPSSGCTEGKGRIDSGSGACQKGYFETADLSGLADQNKVDAEGQTEEIPFFVYDNQSTSGSDLNITLDLNEALPASLHLKVSKIYTGWAWGCTGNTDSNCAEINTSAVNIGKAIYTTGQTQDLNIFIWGDFNGAVAGRTDKNAESTSIAP
ncbi:MAG: hypothetical protein PHH08_03775, partial [Candidatus ainarchaeum sp.]|nr:hypothetical protein [Candidatus ainarchaeum sp.]